MDDYIDTRRRVRQGIEDFMAADPSITMVAASGLIVDRAGVEHVRPSELERCMMQWLKIEWSDAAESNTLDAWSRLIDLLYGALQACLNHNQVEAYFMYSFLAGVARERRLLSMIIPVPAKQSAGEGEP